MAIAKAKDRILEGNLVGEKGILDKIISRTRMNVNDCDWCERYILYIPRTTKTLVVFVAIADPEPEPEEIKVVFFFFGFWGLAFARPCNSFGAMWECVWVQYFGNYFALSVVVAVVTLTPLSTLALKLMLYCFFPTPVSASYLHPRTEYKLPFADIWQIDIFIFGTQYFFTCFGDCRDFVFSFAHLFAKIRLNENSQLPFVRL